MYYIMSFERDEWGKTTWFRRFQFFKNYKTAVKRADSLPMAFVYRYGNKQPVYTHGVMV